MRHRLEIDGLRAVAVIPVIFFHAGFSTFSGGFVGVDVFFVISGYLITSIIYAETSSGTFSILRFYERRARRILPALLTVCAACIPFAYYWMLPSELENFSKSIVSTLLFFSNVLFWRESGYFEAAAELKPLLHTWSLSIEEQFYVCFPIFLILFAKLSRNYLIIIIALLSGISLLTAEYGSRYHPSATFYLLPTRAWELGIGSLLALSFDDLRMRNVMFHKIGSVAGLGLIVFSVFTFSSDTPFPSLWTLLPVIGTALVIVCASREELVGKMLSLRPVVFIGLISYSFYLWHQPLFAFARMRAPHELNVEFYLLLIAAAFLLASFTWLLIEQPFRNRNIIPNKLLIKPLLAAFSVSLMIGAVGIYASEKLSGVKLPKELGRDLGTRLLRETCFEFSLKRIKNMQNRYCVFGPDNARQKILILGDSHSLSFLPVFKRVAESLEIQMYYSGIAECPPLKDTFSVRPNIIQDACKYRNQLAFEDLREGKFDLLILNARWSLYSVGSRNGDLRKIASSFNAREQNKRNESKFVEYLSDTITYSKKNGVKVLLIKEPPLQEYDATLVYKSALLNNSLDNEYIENFSIDFEVYKKDSSLLESVFEQLDRDIYEVVEFFDTSSRLCTGKKCLIGTSRHSFYYDDDHLSNRGASLYEDELRQILGSTY